MRDYFQYWVADESPLPPATVADVVELRAAPRFAAAGAALLESVDLSVAGASAVEAELIDVSDQGLGVVSSVPVESGSHWRVLFLDGARRVGEYFLTVRHCRERKDGRYHVGCQFSLSPGLLEMLTGEPEMMPA